MISQLTTPQNCLTYVFETQLGWIAIQWLDTRVIRITIGHGTPKNALDILPVADDPATTLPRDCRTLVKRITRHISGKPADFDDVEIDFTDYSPFQLLTLNECRKIAWGQTITYGELAAMAGSPRAARAVGTVMSCNRYPLIIPCHRVVAAGNRIGGYGGPGGVSLKKQLLAIENGS